MRLVAIKFKTPMRGEAGDVCVFASLGARLIDTGGAWENPRHHTNM